MGIVLWNYNDGCQGDAGVAGVAEKGRVPQTRFYECGFHVMRDLIWQRGRERALPTKE